MPRVDPSTDVDVVLLGNDIGVYALARAFHQQYGIRSTVLTRVAAGPVLRSRVLRTIELGADATREHILDTLAVLGGRSAAAGRPAILLGNSDTFAWMLAENLDTLNTWYVLPQVSPQTLDAVCDKVAFAETCAELGIDTPPTTLHDFADSDTPGWEPAPPGLAYPVIAKPAVSARFEQLCFPGKRKIYKLDSEPELATEFGRIRDAGFRDRFLVQELIPGDDTAMRSITAYVDTAGEVTLLASARVLLQDHTPLALGNPTAMLTTPLPELTDAAARFLRRSDYRGFANFDVKRDPRDGRMHFLEVNPRIGRNNHYVTAAGANVARVVMEDLVLGRRAEPVVVDREIAYSVLPLPLVRRYLDRATRADLTAAVRSGGLHHPLRYRESLAHRAYTAAALLNQVRKYRTHYPRATSTGF